MIQTHFEGCTTGDIRLVDGSTPLEGRVEVCMNNQWGIVCHSGWGQSDAQVVCTQLGLSATGLFVMDPHNNACIMVMYTTGATSATFGRGSRPVFLTNVGCVGSESRLLDCRASTVSARYCSTSFSDAGVRCLQRTG